MQIQAQSFTETCGNSQGRRLITLPPCIRFIVCDASTRKEVDFTYEMPSAKPLCCSFLNQSNGRSTFSEVDSTIFVLMVDLWNADGTHEVNLIRHSSGAPTVSISSSTTTSYPPPDRPPMQTYHNLYGQPALNLQPQGNPYSAPSPIPPSHYPPTPNTPITLARFQYPSAPNVTGTYVPMTTAMLLPPPLATTTKIFIRNLISSLTVNTFRLIDTEGKVGFWFVLQDLSIRTEGNFRQAIVSLIRFFALISWCQT